MDVEGVQELHVCLVRGRDTLPWSLLASNTRSLSLSLKVMGIEWRKTFRRLLQIIFQCGHYRALSMVFWSGEEATVDGVAVNKK